MFSHCADSHQTLCVKCNRGEYQPNWNGEARCHQQKLCDPGRSLQHEQETVVQFLEVQALKINVNTSALAKWKINS